MDKTWRPHKYGKMGKVGKECPQVSGFGDGMESVPCNRPTLPVSRGSEDSLERVIKWDWRDKGKGPGKTTQLSSFNAGCVSPLHCPQDHTHCRL